MVTILSLLLLSPQVEAAPRISIGGITGEVRRILTAEQQFTTRSGDRFNLVSDDGGAFWSGHDGVRRLGLDGGVSPLEFHFLTMAQGEGREALLPICEWSQWLWLRSNPAFAGKYKLPVESRASIRDVLGMENESRSSVAYIGSNAVGRGDGIAEVDVRPDGWHSSKTIFELKPGESILAAAESCQGGSYAYIASSRLGSAKSSSVPKLKFWPDGMTFNLPVSHIWGPMLFDQQRGIAVISHDRDWLTVFSQRRQQSETLRVPNAGAADMYVFSLAWEKKGTMLVDVRKAIRWEGRKTDTYIPKLYRLDPVSGRFEYLGSFFLLGSSRDGSYLIICAGSRLTRASLIKRD